MFCCFTPGSYETRIRAVSNAPLLERWQSTFAIYPSTPLVGVRSFLSPMPEIALEALFDADAYLPTDPVSDDEFCTIVCVENDEVPIEDVGSTEFPIG